MGQEEGNTQRLWPRARVNEEAPVAVGSGWGGTSGQAGSSERVKDGQSGPAGAQSKGAVREAFLEEEALDRS